MTEERQLTLWNGQIRPTVRIAGSGEPIVFLHSAFGPMWVPFLDALARDHTVYAPSHPGTGPDDVDGIRALEDLWDLVLYYYELFDALGLKSPAVVGHSFGGMIAAELAASDPARVGKLALIDAYGLWRDDTPVPLASAIAPKVLARRIFHDPGDPATKLTFPDHHDHDAVIRVTWSINCANKFIWPLPDKGLKKRIHRINAPTLIVWGRHDGLMPPVYAEEFQSKIAGSQVAIVEDASHMCPLERPEIVAGLITDFLES